MADFAVAAVGDRGGGEQRGRLAVRQIRQEAPEPGHKSLARQHAAHQFGLHQRRRKELIAARFPRLTMYIPEMPAQGRFFNQRGQCVMLYAAGVIMR
ncbi:hypothetical protein D3C80_1968170 [compost metagenome]